MKNKEIPISCLTELFLSLFPLFVSSLLLSSPTPNSKVLGSYYLNIDSDYLFISLITNKLKKAHFPLKTTFNKFLWRQKKVQTI